MKPEIISGYRVLSELGKGSMGVVYEAVPEAGGQPVAIKVFYPDANLAADERSVLLERFEREGGALAQLQHDNVVRVIEVGAAADLEFIAMEKLEGFNIKELLALGTRFTLAETFDLCLQLLAGLAACHRAGLVHRDVKPANVVRDPQGVLKLTDFGIARIITDETLSRAGTIVGTPNYMSPEQIRGEEVDPRSDLFSVGVLFYELLTGKKPFDAPDVTAIMYNVTNVHPPSPLFYNAALPAEVEEIAFRALAKNPNQRYATADEFAEHLRRLERDLHYREDSQTFLDALPASPDADSGSAALDSHQIAPAADPAAVGTAPPPDSDAWSLTGGGGIVAGTVYCVDCGMKNDAGSDFCVRCMRPLLKRDIVNQLAAEQARRMHRVGRGDYVFLTCLSIVIVAVLILVLYLFFRGVTPP